MLDLTKQIKLNNSWKKRYEVMQIFVYITFFCASLYFAYKILFPTISFVYSFQNSNSLKNTIIYPRTDQGENKNGKIAKDQMMFFDSAFLGNFSEGSVEITLAKKSQPLENGKIEIRKSYQAFLYPLAESMVFKNGSLLNYNNEYYVVSNGKLRKFSSTDIMDLLGYDKKNFESITEEEISLMQKGDTIDDNNHPDGTLFRINDDYYQLENQKLRKFISARAFLSNFEEKQALARDLTLFEKYAIDENPTGFADGTLASWGDSVYILSKGKSYPIDNITTFEAMGFNWNDVLPITSEELSAYEKQKLFTQSSPHPDGIIFAEKQNKNYYIVDNGSIRILKGQAILKSYLKKDPVLVDAESRINRSSCLLSKELLNTKKYNCQIKLDQIKNFSGNNYQFQLSSSSDINIDQLDVKLFTPLKFSDMKYTLSEIKKRIISNYNSQQ